MWEKYVLFANTWAYLLPSSDLHLPSIVSVDHSPERVFLLNTLSALYLLDSGRMAERRNFCVVFFRVLEAVLKLMPHLSLSCWGVTSVCLSELWNVCNAGASEVPGSIDESRCSDFAAGSSLIGFGFCWSNDDIFCWIESSIWNCVNLGCNFIWGGYGQFWHR